MHRIACKTLLSKIVTCVFVCIRMSKWMCALFCACLASISLWFQSSTSTNSFQQFRSAVCFRMYCIAVLYFFYSENWREKKLYLFFVRKWVIFLESFFDQVKMRTFCNPKLMDGKIEKLLLFFVLFRFRAAQTFALLCIRVCNKYLCKLHC